MMLMRGIETRTFRFLFFIVCLCLSNLGSSLHDRENSTLPSIMSVNSKEAQKRYLFFREKYKNEPPIIDEDEQRKRLTPLELPKVPVTPLLHRAPEPPQPDFVLGLAAYASFDRGFKRLVGSLRQSKYNGHIILGVHPNIPQNELKYLKEMNVTTYTVHACPCDPSVLPQQRKDLKGNGQGAGIRSKCSKGLEKFTLELGRYEMARQWLHDCKTCTGWGLIMDTRDVFFQSDPFEGLGSAKSAEKNLLFIEEISPLTSPDPDPARSFVAGNFRSMAHTLPCYGSRAQSAYKSRPVLCSGTIIGTRDGMFRFLNVLVNEFMANNEKSNPFCKSPHTTDQWIMNEIYYKGLFGEIEKTQTIPWGMGPVLTVGKACVTKERKLGAQDLVPRNVEGQILNLYDGKIAPVVHQFDRCGKWMADEMIRQIFSRKDSIG